MATASDGSDSVSCRSSQCPAPNDSSAEAMVSGRGWNPRSPAKRQPDSGIPEAMWGVFSHWIRNGMSPPPGRRPSSVRVSRQWRVPRLIASTFPSGPRAAPRQLIDPLRAERPGNQPRSASQFLPHGRGVQFEPTGSLRHRCSGIHRDDFEIAVRTQPDQPVVRSHDDVLAATRRRHSEPLRNERRTLFQAVRRQHDVIQLRRFHTVFSFLSL